MRSSSGRRRERIRRSVAKWFTALRRDSQQSPSGIASTDPTGFVRARPKNVLVEERLAYRQEISRTPGTKIHGQPEGRISIHLPFDGHHCFDRDAHADAERLLDRSTHSRHAMVGHLVFVEYDETNLAEVLKLAGKFGSFPLRLPIRSPKLPDSHALIADKHAYRQVIRYAPTSGPKVVPLKIIVELFDPGHQDDEFLGRSELELIHGNTEIRRAVAAIIKKSAEFQPYLTMRIRVLLNLPAVSTRLDSDESPVVRAVRLTLPGTTTLPASSVQPDGINGLQIDVRTGSFEWLGEPMMHGDLKPETVRKYWSKDMTLRFLQPGEVFLQKKLRVKVDVEVPGELLSGTQVRLFSATGAMDGADKRKSLKVRTVISNTCTVVLHDAFAERQISPSQSFTFDELIPDEQRLADVRAALIDQRFDIGCDAAIEQDNKKRLQHLFIATRRDGPDMMQLWIYAEGRRHPTQREARHPGGHRYRSKFQSGTLEIHIRGLVRADARGVTREINGLHLSLRSRFRRMKALR
jgi:hypothetical protein